MEYQSNKATFIVEGGIIIVRYKEEAEIELDDVIEHSKILKEITNGVKMPILVDGRKAHAVSPEAREFAASPQESALRSAQALLVNSLAAKLVANFYINFNKPLHPVKVFKTEKAAIKWLQEYL
jgi:hypothetical protein